MRIFVCKLRLHFPDSKHFPGFVCHEIFGNVFLHSEMFFFIRIANTFLASYAMKYSEMFFFIRKFLAYTPPPPPQLYMLATALGAMKCIYHLFTETGRGGTSVFCTCELEAAVVNIGLSTYSIILYYIIPY
jgi:hypothetical protein